MLRIHGTTFFDLTVLLKVLACCFCHYSIVNVLVRQDFFTDKKILNSVLRFENFCFYIFQCFALILGDYIVAQQDNYYSVSLFSVKIKTKSVSNSFCLFSDFSMPTLTSCGYIVCSTGWEF